MIRAPSVGPAGHHGWMSTPTPTCPDCYGTGRQPNNHAHDCDGPLCQADQPTVACECSDDAVPDDDAASGYRPGVVL